MDEKTSPPSAGGDGIQPAQQPAPSAEPAPGPASRRPGEPDYLFYNVMPPEKNQGAVVSPTVHVASEPPSAGGKSGDGSPNKKYVIYGLIGLAVIALAYGAYFAINKYATSSYPTEDLLIKNPPAGSQGTGQQQGTATTPSDWQKKYFGGESCADDALCGDAADPDHDGLTNVEEYRAGTDPNNADSDKDGLADGDELKVFGGNPLDMRTAKNQSFTDVDYVKGAVDMTQENQKLTQAEIDNITANMRQYGLHQPTVATLGTYLITIYHFDPETMDVSPSQSATGTPSSTSDSATGTSSPLSSLDNSAAAKQDRDAKRSETIKNISIALVKYNADLNTYPMSGDFAEMFGAVKPYVRVAINPIDPINWDYYVYTYAPSPDGKDFTLTFYSETQGQLIKTAAAEAQKYASDEQAGIYDNKRITDLDTLRSALLLYSNKNIAGNQTYVFPTAAKYKTELVPEFISSIPKDPKTGGDYAYSVSKTFDTFTLKAVLDNPPTGTTGYLCNQDECTYY